MSFASPLTGGSLSPEADGGNDNPIRMAQAAWTSPLTSKVLLEASFGLGPQAVFGAQERPDNNRDVISVIEASGLVPGIEYRGQAPWARNWGEMYTYGGSLSYVTGAHRFKVGGRQQRTNAAFVSYYNNQRLALQLHERPPDGVDDVREPRGQQCVRDVHDGVLCPGPVDRRPSDAAGWASLRADRQLLPGGPVCRRSVPPDCVDLSRRRMPASVRRTSTRGSARRTTCLATARRRSSSAWGGIRPPTTRTARTACSNSRRPASPPAQTAIGTISPSRSATRGEATSHPTAT